MRAIVLGGSAIRLDLDYPKPARAKGEALIRPILAGVCNTDMELAKGYMGFGGVLGHEFVGVVESADDKSLVGKRVAGEINCACGVCRYCAGGLSNHCPNRTVLGILNRDGAFADYLTLPEKNLHLIPDTVSDMQAVFIEPLAAAFQIERQVSIKREHKVAVLGDGKLGLLIAQALKLTGCDLVAIGKRDNRLGILGKLGIKTMKTAETDGLKWEFDIVVDATGSSHGLDDAVRLVKPRGVIVLKTTVAEKRELDLNALVINEVTVTGSRCGPFERAISALEKREVDVEPLISCIMKLGDGAEVMEHAKNRDVIKVLVRMDSA